MSGAALVVEQLGGIGLQPNAGNLNGFPPFLSEGFRGEAMADTKYNGWTNYETWNVALWLDNEEGSYSYWTEQAQDRWNDAGLMTHHCWTREEAATYTLADQLKDELTEANPLQEASLYCDLLNAALSEVNWSEIARHYIDEVDKTAEEEDVEA